MVQSSETAINLDVHSWTLEKYDHETGHVVSWSTLFERETRRVPPTKEWNEMLRLRCRRLKGNSLRRLRRG